ncbi:hypothetical protein, partial [Mesorhizobium sp. M2C.T.Ca.TU.002.02.1.1]|uniref:hypothetical protein n=1 Tax=Mesorhizobium sp. M2C.T.Ca.TU.002.02.1.1 TaxID=2496788 RepID=UPI0013E3EFD0
AEMERELDKARPIRFAGQPAALLIRQRGYHGAMVDGFVVVDCVHKDHDTQKETFRKTRISAK